MCPLAIMLPPRCTGSGNVYIYTWSCDVRYGVVYDKVEVVQVEGVEKVGWFVERLLESGLSWFTGFRDIFECDCINLKICYF